jgi:hypothetical protein
VVLKVEVEVNELLVPFDLREPTRLSDEVEQCFEWSGSPVGVDPLDEEWGVRVLSTAAGTNESAQLMLDSPGPLVGHLLHYPEALKIALRLQETEHSVDSQRTNHLVFKIQITDEEPESLKTFTGGAGVNSGGP